LVIPAFRICLQNQGLFRRFMRSRTMDFAFSICFEFV
jgi:hypothetical protein